MVIRRYQTAPHTNAEGSRGPRDLAAEPRDRDTIPAVFRAVDTLQLAVATHSAADDLLHDLRHDLADAFGVTLRDHV